MSTKLHTRVAHLPSSVTLRHAWFIPHHRRRSTAFRVRSKRASHSTAISHPNPLAGLYELQPRRQEPVVASPNGAKTAQVNTSVSAMLSGLRLATVFLGVVALGLSSEALAVRKPSPVTLPFARRFNSTGATKILEHDQARAKTLKARALAKPGQFSRRIIDNDPVTNQAVDYVATVSSPAPSLLSATWLTESLFLGWLRHPSV